MKNKYPHIFEPMTIRRMTVKNRIVMTPMGTNYGEQNGEMSFLHINYYEQRAKANRKQDVKIGFASGSIIWKKVLNVPHPST